MYSQSVLELRNVVITTFVRFIRYVQCNTHIQTEYDEAHVVAYTNTSS